MTSISPSLATLPRDVIQRSGERAAFDAGRIASAIARAGAATGELHRVLRDGGYERGLALIDDPDLADQ